MISLLGWLSTFHPILMLIIHQLLGGLQAIILGVAGLSIGSANYNYSSFLLPNEVKPPMHVASATTEGELSQEGYDQQVLSSVAREQLSKFQVDLDSFGEQLGETTFGRAQFINESLLQSVSCCYGATPILTDDPPAYGTPANLTAIPKYIQK